MSESVSVIRIPSVHRGQDLVIEVGIERAYRPNPMGSNYCSLKIGLWEVFVRDRGIMSSFQVPPEHARKIAEAIIHHAAEADRLNSQPSEPDNGGRGMDDPVGDGEDESNYDQDMYNQRQDSVLDPRD